MHSSYLLIRIKFIKNKLESTFYGVKELMKKKKSISLLKKLNNYFAFQDKDNIIYCIALQMIIIIIIIKFNETEILSQKEVLICFFGSTKKKVHHFECHQVGQKMSRHFLSVDEWTEEEGRKIFTKVDT